MKKKKKHFLKDKLFYLSVALGYILGGNIIRIIQLVTGVYYNWFTILFGIPLSVILVAKFYNYFRGNKDFGWKEIKETFK